MKRTISIAAVVGLLSGCGLTVTRTPGTSAGADAPILITTGFPPGTTTTTSATADSTGPSPTTSSVAETTTTAAKAATTVAGSSATADGALGTRENPIPIGTTAEVGDGWTMTVNSVNLDAKDVIIDANSYIDPPPEGRRFVLVNVTTAYNGSEESSYGIDLEVLGAATNKPASSWDSTKFLVPPDPKYDGGELFQGGSETGNEAFEIANEDADSLVIIAKLPLNLKDDSRTFFATK